MPDEKINSCTCRCETFDQPSYSQKRTLVLTFKVCAINQGKLGQITKTQIH